MSTNDKLKGAQADRQPSLDHQALWAHFKEQANNIKETMASISTWTFGIASGILAFVITKFLSFEPPGITSHHPVLATVVSFGGMALILYLLMMIRHFDARVRGDLERAQACEPYVTGLAEVMRSGDQHDANISTLASRLRVFAYFYLAAFLAAIVYIWARRT